MFNSIESLDKEKTNLNDAYNDSLEKTHFASKLNLNNDSFLKFNNDILSENNSHCFSDDLALNCFFPKVKDSLNPIHIPIRDKIFLFDKNVEKNKAIHVNKSNNIKQFKMNGQLNLYNYKIFNIEKCKKLGRHRKYCIKKGKHDKFQNDNLIRKFKSHLSKNIFNYVNSCFLINENIKPEKHINVLKTLNSKAIKSISKKDNIKWLNMTLKEFFSQNISTKLCHYNLDYNEKLIDKIYKKHEEKKVLNILNKKIKDMWRVYVSEIKDDNYKGFKTLTDDIEQLKKNGENEEYIRKYKIISCEFERIFNRMIGRKRKCNYNY